MNRLARRALEAPVTTRRAVGLALLLALGAASAVVPAAAQPRTPEHFAGSSQCVGPADERLVDEGEALFHGATWGVQLAAGSGGTVYAADVNRIRNASQPGAPALYTGSDLELIRGITAVGSQVLWTDTHTGVVRVRTLGPAEVWTGPAVPESARHLEHGIALGADGNLYVAVPGANQILKVGAGAPVAQGINQPQSLVAVEEAGKTILYVGGSGDRVLRLDPATGETTPVGAPVTLGGVYSARIAVDPVGRQLFVADSRGVSQIDLPTEPSRSTLIHELPGGQITGLAVVRASSQAAPRVVFANNLVPTGRMVPNDNYRPGAPGLTGLPEIPEERCDIQAVVANDPVLPTTTSAPSTVPSTIPTTVPNTTPSSIPRLGAPEGEPSPGPLSGGQGSGAGSGAGAPDGGSAGAGSGAGAGDGGATGGTAGAGQSPAPDASQLAGTRATGEFGQFNPFAGGAPAASGGTSFTPFLSAGGQQFGAFGTSPAATDPFSGGGAVPGLTAPGPGEVAAAGVGGSPPPASVATPGPVGAAVPPPAGAPLGAGSAAPVQGWPGAPADPARGAARYAMTAGDDEGGLDPVLAGLLGLGGCCLFLAVGAGTRRGGGAAATAAAPAPARAWAAGR